MGEQDLPHLVDIQEMSKILRVSKNWLYQRTRLGPAAIPFIRVGRYVRFDPKVVLEFLGKPRVSSGKQGSAGVS